VVEAASRDAAITAYLASDDAPRLLFNLQATPESDVLPERGPPESWYY
jgi:hypothetical protein